MSIQVTTRGSGVTQGMKQYVTEKVEKLQRIFNGVRGCEVILGAEGQGFRAEVIVALDGAAPIASHAEHEQMNAAIDLTIDRAEAQLRKHKEKIRDHKRGAAAAPPPAPAPALDPDANLETYDDVIEKRDFPT